VVGQVRRTVGLEAPPTHPDIGVESLRDGEAIFRHACALRLEGIVFKRAGGRWLRAD
jgi:ATP-dependent DNA ligase